MFLHLACLPLAAVLINDVRTQSTDGALTIDVATSEPVSRADVRGVSGGPRRLYVYVQGAQASRSSFGSGSESVFVHPRARYTKLEIPTDGRCAEPMSVEATAAGIRVRAACPNAGMPAGALAPPVRRPGKDHAEDPSPDAPVKAMARTPAQSDSLRAALALPPEVTGGDKEADGASAEDVGRGAAPVDKLVKSAALGTDPSAVAKTADNTVSNGGKAAAPSKPAALAPTTQPDAPMAALASTDSSGPSSAGSPGSSGGESKSSSNTFSTILAVLLLVGLGVAATVLARRRAKGTRMIRIVETASIGPRRSLVVATIGGRTMVLGVSEAGVALLDAQAATIAAPVTLQGTQSASLEEAVQGLRGIAQARMETPAESERTAEDTKHEGSLLSRLFQRVPSPTGATRRGHEFEDLLSESVEDQDLRRKLSLGEAGRVA